MDGDVRSKEDLAGKSTGSVGNCRSFWTAGQYASGVMRQSAGMGGQQ